MGSNYCAHESDSIKSIRHSLRLLSALLPVRLSVLLQEKGMLTLGE